MVFTQYDVLIYNGGSRNDSRVTKVYPILNLVVFDRMVHYITDYNA